MLDLDAIKARADKATAYIEGGEHDIFMTFDKLCELADDIPGLIAELRAARAASAYRATATTLHQEIERRTGVERRMPYDMSHMLQFAKRRIGPDLKPRSFTDRRKSWPR